MRVLPPTLLLEDAPMRVDPKADELADPKRALLGPAHGRHMCQACLLTAGEEIHSRPDAEHEAQSKATVLLTCL